MKFRFFFLMGAVLSIVFAHGDVSTPRMYVSPEMIQVSQNGIFLKVEGVGPVPVRAIHHDMNGLFVTGFNIFNLWQCGICKYYNNNQINTCQNCGEPRPIEVEDHSEDVVIFGDIEDDPQGGDS